MCPPLVRSLTKWRKRIDNKFPPFFPSSSPKIGDEIFKRKKGAASSLFWQTGRLVGKSSIRLTPFYDVRFGCPLHIHTKQVLLVSSPLPSTVREARTAGAPFSRKSSISAALRTDTCRQGSPFFPSEPIEREILRVERGTMWGPPFLPSEKTFTHFSLTLQGKELVKRRMERTPPPPPPPHPPPPKKSRNHLVFPFPPPPFPPHCERPGDKNGISPLFFCAQLRGGTTITRKARLYIPFSFFTTISGLSKEEHLDLFFLPLFPTPCT